MSFTSKISKVQNAFTFSTAIFKRPARESSPSDPIIIGQISIEPIPAFAALPFLKGLSFIFEQRYIFLVYKCPTAVFFRSALNSESLNVNLKSGANASFLQLHCFTKKCFLSFNKVNVHLSMSNKETISLVTTS